MSINSSDKAPMSPEEVLAGTDSAELSYADFPDHPEWGVGGNYDKPGVGAEYGVGHTPELNYARALEAIEATTAKDLPVDQKLAIAACLANQRSPQRYGGGEALYLYKVTVDPANGDVYAEYRQWNAAGGSSIGTDPFGMKFTAEQIAEYHIPTQANANMDEVNMSNPQEAMFDLAAQPDNNLEIEAYGSAKNLDKEVGHRSSAYGQEQKVDRDNPIEQIRLAITKNGKYLARIPFKELELTPAEQWVMDKIQEVINKLAEARDLESPVAKRDDIKQFKTRSRVRIIEAIKKGKASLSKAGRQTLKSREIYRDLLNLDNALQRGNEVADLITKLEARIVDARTSGAKLIKVSDEMMQDYNELTKIADSILAKANEFVANTEPVRAKAA